MCAFPRKWIIAGLFAMLLAVSTAAAETTREKRGAELINVLATALRNSTNETQRALILEQMTEVEAAIANSRRSPVPQSIDAFLLPLIHYRYASARVGIGTRPAANIPQNGGGTSLHLLDPPPSSFWKRPAYIPAHDLRTGFARTAPEAYEDSIWEYAGPKNGYGGHPGFEARSGSRRIKIKFGEIHSEPFTARIFHALGYNVDPTDYSPGLKVRFDPRLFAEFNSRKPVNTRITLLGVLPVWTLRFQPVHDPFKFIRHAMMKGGAKISATELKSAMEKSDFSTVDRIDYLVTVPANVQPKVDGESNIGPWAFDQLGHEHRRELRGAGLLAAWVGWHDSRFENTRLRVAQRDGTVVLKHCFSDLGGGLGRANGLLSRSAEDIHGFPDAFTRPELRQGPHRMTRPFRIIKFRPIEPTDAFKEMTMDDARWMAGFIAQLTSKQIEDALGASGFAKEEAQIVAGKLLSRRQLMLEHLGLGNRTTKVNSWISSTCVAKRCG